MSVRNFHGGPRDNTSDESYGVIPPQRIPIYAQPDTGMVCDDEQVRTKLGYYERVTRTIYGWSYEWVPND